MPVTHVNRKGKTYYLHEGVTKTGKPKYHFSLKGDGRLVAGVPEGYEVYENANAQVFLRRIRPKLIADRELKCVKRELKRHRHLRHALCDVKGKVLTVFEPNQDVEELVGLLTMLSPVSREWAEQRAVRMLHYTPMLRFALIDADARVFEAERFCFLGGIDDWVPIGDAGDLDSLAKQFIRHVGRESFYELM